MKVSDSVIVTEEKLNQALDRLLQGVPQNTKPDGKINLKRINDEAKLSSGSIYYYKEFLEKARKIIADLKFSNNKHYSPNKGEIARLRSEREKQKELKVKYRDQRDAMKSFADGVVNENAKLNFALFETITKIEQLEKELLTYKVTNISEKVK